MEAYKAKKQSHQADRAMFLTLMRRGSSLLALLITLIGVRSQENIVEPLPESAHFVKEGSVVLSNERVDFVLDIDLSDNQRNVHEVRTYVYKLIEAQNHAFHTTNNKKDFIGSVLADRLRHLVDTDVTRWQRIETTLTGQSPTETNDNSQKPNEKRFVFGVLLSALVGGVTGLLWGRHQDHETLKQVAKEQGRVIAVVKEEQVRIKDNKVHIDLLRRELQKEYSRIEVIRNVHEAMITALITLEAQDRQLSELELLVHSVIAEGRVPATVMAGEAIQRHVAAVIKDVEQRKEELAASNPAELARCRASHGTFSSHKWRVVIHIPTRAVDNTFQVLRYVNLPFAIAGSSGHGVLELEGHSGKIAVCQATSRMFDLPQTEWDGSLRLKGSLFISQGALTMPLASPRAGCLAAVMRGDRAQVLERCKIKAVTETRAVRLSGWTWGICSQAAERWNVECEGKTVYVSTVRGCRKMSLQPGCSFTAGDLQLRAARHFQPGQLQIHAAPLDLKAGELNLAAGAWNSSSETDRQRTTWQSGTILHDARDLRAVQVPEEGLGQNEVLVIAGGAAAVVIVVLLALISKWLRNWCRRRARTSSSGIRGGQSQEEMENTSSTKLVSGAVSPMNPWNDWRGYPRPMTRMSQAAVEAGAGDGGAGPWQLEQQDQEWRGLTGTFPVRASTGRFSRPWTGAEFPMTEMWSGPSHPNEGRTLSLRSQTRTDLPWTGASTTFLQRPSRRDPRSSIWGRSAELEWEEEEEPRMRRRIQNFRSVHDQPALPALPAPSTERDENGGQEVRRRIPSVQSDHARTALPALPAPVPERRRALPLPPPAQEERYLSVVSQMTPTTSGQRSLSPGTQSPRGSALPELSMAKEQEQQRRRSRTSSGPHAVSTSRDGQSCERKGGSTEKRGRSLTPPRAAGERRGPTTTPTETQAVRSEEKTKKVRPQAEIQVVVQ